MAEEARWSCSGRDDDDGDDDEDDRELDNIDSDDEDSGDEVAQAVLPYAEIMSPPRNTTTCNLQLYFFIYN
jgi:hypothetical protein